ncbi:MAG TPA: Xaa-Pro peptidase family protein [Chloroflexota bacterium]|nr:Xaa-Pro peptidase family protein [Chloroflexota bacterium]
MSAEDRALLLIGDSTNNADMYHAIGFLFGDPVIYLRAGDHETLVCSGFEAEEARRHSRIADVRSYLDPDLGYQRARAASLPHHLAMAEVARQLLESAGASAATVPDTIPLSTVDYLRARGIEVICDPEVKARERLVKRPDEIAAIEGTQRATEKAMRRAIDLIAGSEPRAGFLFHQDRPLTAEDLQLAIDQVFLEERCLAEGTITSGGTDTASPHHRGAGHLRAAAPIVLDIFPRHKDTRYFADMTRTVSKGDPGPAIRGMFEATLRAQEAALALIADGVSGKNVYEAACRVFEDAGYPTSLRTGGIPATGFIHGLGHGVGLEIHEGPRMSFHDETLHEGQIVTVEPGLYDPAIGGVRIEDLVVVTGDGCRNLTRFEKVLVV